ncbi:MAG: hypothetical protein WAZ19_01995 [Anaerolineae bacterium]
MNTKVLFEKTLIVAKFYLDCIDRLEKEVKQGCYSIRDFTIAGIFEFQQTSIEYLDLARADDIDYAVFDTSVSKIEQRLSEFTARRDALLAQLGPEETQRRLLEEVTFLVKAYCSTVNVIHHTWDEMAAEEYEEFQQDDEFSDLETFTLRGSIHELLPLLVEGEAKSALERDLTQADATLRRYGAEIFGPLLRMGSIQQQREARFEPREHWWWYVDEISAG